MSVLQPGVVLLVLLFLTLIHCTKYLEFSNQEEVAVNKPTNYAILKGGSASKPDTSGFTICGSIYVGYFRGRQAFYTMRQNRSDNLWFSLYLHEKEMSLGYGVGLAYYGESSYNTGKVPLRPHAWSHACTSVDSSGHVLVVINGVLTHDVNTNLQFPKPLHFEGNLLLGTAWYQFGSLNKFQSEASVTNVNIFSGQLSLTRMEEITSTGQCTQGDILSQSCKNQGTPEKVLLEHLKFSGAFLTKFHTHF